MHTFGMQVPPNSDNHGNLDFSNSEATTFVRKVNELLSHHKGNKLKEFKVEFPLSSAHASELDRWVAFAVASHAETLTLSLCDEHGRIAIDHREAYFFPLKQFSDVGGCQLHVLSLYECIFETVPANLSGFSCLYSLSLCNVRVVDEVLLSIMSSCNALCYLYLRSCHKLIDLRVSHAQLVNLEVYSCGRLRNISIHAEKLESFSYKGRRVDIEYECVPVLSKLGAYFGILKHTLDLLDNFPNKLKVLTLHFPSRCQVSRILQHNGRFAVLKEITLCIKMRQSWKNSIRIVALILQSAPLVETLNLEVCGNLRPLKMLKIRWPKNFTAASLRTIRIGGFSGESELVHLLLFLLRRSPVLKTLVIRTHQVRHPALRISEIERSKDAALRCNYGREVAQTHLAPNVPATVKLSIM
ncbi:hypothetical protein BDA96_02G031700 [Sorghum bicolor]|nr:hypothetical protein BDA96_02G031700 [Sorghum bicolor]KXG34385.1 hypothetical protein SORBI_3002G031400 [Sorghum bicolor]